MLEQIKEIVNRKTCVDIDLKSRKINVVEARSVYIRLCREFTNYGYQTIADSLDSIKKHETVMHSYNMSWQYLNYNDKIKSIYLDIAETIKFYNTGNYKDLIDAENKKPVKAETLKTHVNKDLLEKGLVKYKSLINLILDVPEGSIEDVEGRLKVIIKCLPKKRG